MLKILQVVLTLGTMQVSLASFEREGEGARMAALGGAGMALSGDPWGFTLNPACRMHHGETYVGFMHVPSSLGFRELSRSGFIFVESGSVGSFSASGVRFGFDLYQELTFRLTLGTELVPGLCAGAALHCDRLAIKGYGSAWSVAPDLGLLWTPFEWIQFGFTATNVNAPVIGRARERLPQTIGIGVAYAPVQGVLVLCDLVKDIRYPAEFRFGIEYSPVEPVALRAGTGRDPASFGGGIGITLDPVIVEYSLVRHESLGITHRCGVTIRLGKE